LKIVLFPQQFYNQYNWGTFEKGKFRIWGTLNTFSRSGCPGPWLQTILNYRLSYEKVGKRSCTIIGLLSSTRRPVIFLRRADNRVVLIATPCKLLSPNKTRCTCQCIHKAWWIISHDRTHFIKFFFERYKMSFQC
jgi:hypothetical protein